MSEQPAAASDFKQRDAASYDEVTAAFDRYTERFTGGIAERLVALARVAPDDRVLDVGTGTGVVAFAAAKRLTGRGTLTGIDLSDGMLGAVRAKAAGHGSKLAFEKMDAEALALPDASFDCVLSLYALRHFPHPEAALAEMRRVLRPGGRLAVGVGSPPQLLSGAGVSAALRRVRELAAGALGRRDLVACGYLDHLVEKHVPAARADEEAGWTHEHHVQSPVPVMVRDAGFTDVRVTWAGHDGVLATNEEFWEVQVTFSSLARKRLAHASPAALDALRREFDAGCDRARAAGARLRYPTGALIVTGLAPARA